MDPRVAYLWGVVTAFGVIGGGWLILRLLAPWFMARATGVPISLVQIFGMRMRGSDPALIITASNTLTRFGEAVSPIDLEAAYLGLPEDQRNLGALLRSVRPALMARLLDEARTHEAGGAA